MARALARDERYGGEVVALQNGGLHEAPIELRTPFSDTDFEPVTLIDLLRYRARHQSERRAYTFLADREEAECSVNYEELDRRGQSVDPAADPPRVLAGVRGG